MKTKKQKFDAHVDFTSAKASLLQAQKNSFAAVQHDESELLDTGGHDEQCGTLFRSLRKSNMKNEEDVRDQRQLRACHSSSITFVVVLQQLLLQVFIIVIATAAAAAAEPRGTAALPLALGPHPSRILNDMPKQNSVIFI
jgi:hypothetical protein